jgi:protein SCO1/2
MFFGYTHCPDVCPGTMGALAVAMRGLPESITDRIAVVFVTVDPARDTPQALTDWIANFDPEYTALSGTDQAIVRIQESFGVKPAERVDYGGGEYGMDHAAYVLAFTTDGLAHAIYPFGMTVERFAHDLPILVEEGWKEI